MFRNELEYNEAVKMHNAYNAAAEKYRTENKTNGIPVEICNTFPYADKVDNNLRSNIEVWEFMQDKPNKYFLYINEKENIATTWTGQKLGNVHLGRPFRSNFGDVRQYIDVYGINGIKYHGIYFKSAGGYARIKAYKNIDQ